MTFVDNYFSEKHPLGFVIVGILVVAGIGSSMLSKKSSTTEIANKDEAIANKDEAIEGDDFIQSNQISSDELREQQNKYIANMGGKRKKTYRKKGKNKKTKKRR
jgi:hypothetical protein